jgi:quinol monooxygenase YgiN
MSTALIRYRVKPGRAEENEELVRAVYAELAELAPPGFRYATFRDGDAFTHVAFTDGEPPLPSLPAFQRFQAGLEERCAEPPRVRRDPIGAYVSLAPAGT